MCLEFSMRSSPVRVPRKVLQTSDVSPQFSPQFQPHSLLAPGFPPGLDPRLIRRPASEGGWLVALLLPTLTPVTWTAFLADGPNSSPGEGSFTAVSEGQLTASQPEVLATSGLAHWTGVLFNLCPQRQFSESATWPPRVVLAPPGQ